MVGGEAESEVGMGGPISEGLAPISDWVARQHPAIHAFFLVVAVNAVFLSIMLATETWPPVLPSWVYWGTGTLDTALLIYHVVRRSRRGWREPPRTGTPPN